MSAKAKKFQGMILNKNGRYNELHDFNIGGFTIRSKNHVELLGIEIDFKLNLTNIFLNYVKKRVANSTQFAVITNLLILMKKRH